MDDQGTIPVAIETLRLRLRELRLTDFDAVHAYANDPEVVRFMPWGPNTEADTLEFLRRASGQALTDPRVGYELAITVRETDGLVGAIGLHVTNESSNEAMLGYCLARPAWGKGYATEASQAMLRFGFLELGLESIWAGCDVDNSGSISVLGKLGMTLQPAVAGAADDQGEPSSLMYRVRASEWKSAGFGI